MAWLSSRWRSTSLVDGAAVNNVDAPPGRAGQRLAVKAQVAHVADFGGQAAGLKPAAEYFKLVDAAALEIIDDGDGGRLRAAAAAALPDAQHRVHPAVEQFAAAGYGGRP